MTTKQMVKSDGEFLFLDFLPAAILDDLTAATLHRELERARLVTFGGELRVFGIPFHLVRAAEVIHLFGPHGYRLGMLRIRSMAYSDGSTRLRRSRNQAPEYTVELELEQFASDEAETAPRPHRLENLRVTQNAGRENE